MEAPRSLSYSVCFCVGQASPPAPLPEGEGSRLRFPHRLVGEGMRVHHQRRLFPLFAQIMGEQLFHLRDIERLGQEGVCA
jgi:hypothetical protein